LCSLGLFIGVASVASGGNRHSLNTRRRLSTWQAGQGQEARSSPRQGTRKQKPRLFFETEKQRFLFVFVEAAEGKQEGLWEGSGHSGQGAVGGHAGTRHE